jgi:hypothetical protein
MGTDKVAFEVVLWGGATGSHVTGSDMTGSGVSHMTGSDHVRKYAMHMRNRKLRHNALVGPFEQKWQSHVTRRGPVRKWPWREVGSAHARFFPRFFLSSSNMATGCDRRSLDPLGVPFECTQLEVAQHP